MRFFCIVSTIVLVSACGGVKPPAVPASDFIVATADSSYWVTSGPHGLKMRGAPMLIARVDGRFVEIFAGDDDRSYYDAVMVGQQLWARDILRGDSTVIFADTLVPRLAKAYAKKHPDEAPLAKDDETSEHPRTTVTADIEVLGVHGPYVSFEYSTDLEILDPRGNTHRHAARRAMLDLRNGKTVTDSAWQNDFRDDLPSGPDSLLTWKRGTTELTAVLANDGESARLFLRDSTRREWPVGSVAAPVWRVIWLDASVTADVRKALRKAFNDASMYNEDAKVVEIPRRAKPRPGVMLLASRRL